MPYIKIHTKPKAQKRIIKILQQKVKYRIWYDEGKEGGKEKGEKKRKMGKKS